MIDGGGAIGNEPGRGVELDREALARLHETYNQCGLTERNNEIEMQKFNPGRQFEALRC